ncbi:MAG: hypothetical protein KY394_02395 [Actinobacteria bacterium]|nr:hypothetical protein [Actinomycetota bacterium]
MTDNGSIEQPEEYREEVLGSAPREVIAEKLGFSPEAVAEKVRTHLGR